MEGIVYTKGMEDTHGQRLELGEAGMGTGRSFGKRCRAQLGQTQLGLFAPQQVQ